MTSPTSSGPPPGSTPGSTRGSTRAHRQRAVIEWVAVVVIALVAAFLVRQYVIQLFYIPSGSMEPRLEIGDQVFVNKLAYDFGDPSRGDVVVFDRPPDWAVDVHDLVKRIVGLPGETIEGRDGHVYINGHRLAEPYLPAGTQTSDFGPLTIPADRYFMMGDNRTHSNDSRSFAPVDRDHFVGKVFMRVWPPGRISIPGWVLTILGVVIALVLLWWGVGWWRRAHAPPDGPATR